MGQVDFQDSLLCKPRCYCRDFSIGDTGLPNRYRRRSHVNILRPLLRRYLPGYPILDQSVSIECLGHVSNAWLSVAVRYNFIAACNVDYSVLPNNSPIRLLRYLTALDQPLNAAGVVRCLGGRSCELIHKQPHAHILLISDWNCQFD